MKTFQRTFLQISRSSYTEAVDFALEAVEEVSGEVKFKVFLELGELSKKLKKVRFVLAECDIIYIIIILTREGFFSLRWLLSIIRRRRF